MSDQCDTVFMDETKKTRIELASEMVGYWSSDDRLGEVDMITRLRFKIYWQNELMIREIEHYGEAGAYQRLIERS